MKLKLNAGEIIVPQWKHNSKISCGASLSYQWTVFTWK